MESEAKFRVADLDAVRAKLSSEGATHTRTVDGEDHLIFVHGRDRDALKDQVLRIRSKPDGGVLTWKGPPADGDVQQRQETSVKVADLAATVDLLGCLGYDVALRFTKHREYWEWNGCKVVLDQLDYGTFVEIEGAESAIEETAAALELDDHARVEEVYPDPNDI